LFGCENDIVIMFGIQEILVVVCTSKQDQKTINNFYDVLNWTTNKQQHRPKERLKSKTITKQSIFIYTFNLYFG
jgi:hypothetical protein